MGASSAKASSSLDLTKTFTSFAGVDIKVILNGHYAGSMQAISYAIQREKAPIYVMGTVDPISFSRGKRGIAGTMISLMMNYHLIYSNSFAKEQAYLDKGEVFAEYINKSEGGKRNDGINDARAVSEANTLRELLGSSKEGGRSQALDIGDPTPNFLQLNFQEVSDYTESDLASNYQVAGIFYMDQVLPFDVVIHAANEYGHSAQMRLFGCEILNEGSGFSIDDMVIENQMTYVCRTLLPWSPLTPIDWKMMRVENSAAAGETEEEVKEDSTGKSEYTPDTTSVTKKEPNVWDWITPDYSTIGTPGFIG